MFMGRRRKGSRGPWVTVAAVAAIALVISAQAYSRADVDVPASARVVAGEEAETNSLLAVATFPPDIPEPEPPVPMTAGEGEEDGAGATPAALQAAEAHTLEPLACGTITNNTGYRIVELAVYGDGDAWGRVSAADEWLEPGASTDLFCDIDGLPPGYYHWQGEVLAEWAEGTARVRFGLAFEVPGGLPVDGSEPPGNEAAEEPADKPPEEPVDQPGEPGGSTEPAEPADPGEPAEPPAEAPAQGDAPRRPSPQEPGGGQVTPGQGEGQTGGDEGKPVENEDPGSVGDAGSDQGAGEDGGGSGPSDGDGKQEDPGGTDAP